MGTKVGVVHCKVTGAIRRVIFPEDDLSLESPDLTAHPNEILLIHDIEGLGQDASPENLREHAKRKFKELGLTHTLTFQTKCAVVDKVTGCVVGFCLASPHIDEVPGCTLILIADDDPVVVGQKWDGSKFVN